VWSLNRVQLMGWVGGDPRVRGSDGAVKVAVFRMATRGAGPKGDTEWHTVVAFGDSAETVAAHVRKGRFVYVEGRLRTRAYTDRDGRRREVTEVVVQTIGFLDADTAAVPQQPPAEEFDDLTADDVAAVEAVTA